MKPCFTPREPEICKRLKSVTGPNYKSMSFFFFLVDTPSVA